MKFFSLTYLGRHLGALLACVTLSSCGGGDDKADTNASISIDNARFTRKVVQPTIVCAAMDPEGARWTQVTNMAAWSARDSHVMFSANKAIFLYGGWEDSYLLSPLDLWSSSEGKTWTSVAGAKASPYSDFASVATAFGRLWMITGWKDGRLDSKGASKEIWSSPDGINWTLAGTAPFSARVGTPLVAFKGRLWILGGTENYFSENGTPFKNDVWSSPDGVTWERVTEHAPWSARAFANAVVLGDKLFLVGGGRYGDGIKSKEFSAEADVWSTKDGVQWVNETTNAGWTPRIWSSLVAYRGALWFMGGWANYPALNHQDVWWSPDGKQWRKLHDAPWSPRHAMATLVFDNQIFVSGGNTDGELHNDVWTLTLDRANSDVCGPGY